MQDSTDHQPMQTHETFTIFLFDFACMQVWIGACKGSMTILRVIVETGNKLKQ